MLSDAEAIDLAEAYRLPQAQSPAEARKAYRSKPPGWEVQRCGSDRRSRYIPPHEGTEPSRATQACRSKRPGWDVQRCGSDRCSRGIQRREGPREACRFAEASGLAGMCSDVDAIGLAEAYRLMKAQSREGSQKHAAFHLYGVAHATGLAEAYRLPQAQSPAEACRLAEASSLAGMCRDAYAIGAAKA